MSEEVIYKFAIKHDKAWAWHTGIFFCVEPKYDDGKRDVYLLMCFGRHDFSIGLLHLWDEDKSEGLM